jgi:hypothetical protein
VHRIAALAKRWILGTHQGSVETRNLGSYLNEFAFRFNRPNSRSRRVVFYLVLELAVDHAPVRYRELNVGQHLRPTPSKPPSTQGHPPTQASFAPPPRAWWSARPRNIPSLAAARAPRPLAPHYDCAPLPPQTPPSATTIGVSYDQTPTGLLSATVDQDRGAGRRH